MLPRVVVTDIGNSRFASSTTGLACTRSMTLVTVIPAQTGEVRENAAEALFFARSGTGIALAIAALTVER